MVRKFVSGWLEITDEDPTTTTGAGTGAGDPGTVAPPSTAPTGDTPADAPGVDVPPVPVPAQPDGQPPINPEAPAVPDGPSADPTTDPATGTTGPAFPGTDLHRDDHQHTPDDDVRTWQDAATAAGYTVGDCDGFFGPKTEAGVIEAQTAAGAPATGVIDAGTWALPWADRQ